MEFINIPRWSAKDVADWMKGLDTVLQAYIDKVLSRRVTGDRLLLMTTPEELEELGIHKIGHQEIMLDAIGLLVNLHYRQSVENLQLVTLNLNTRTNCLTNTLLSRAKGASALSGRNGTSTSNSQSFPASVLVLVAEIVTAAQTVISWLDRPPFVTGVFFQMFRRDILKLALEMTQVVRETGNLPALENKLLELSQEVGDLSDDLVKKASDPLVIQTSTIDFVSVKKKRSEEELGLEIRTSGISGTHLITQIKPSSAAGSTDKIHVGDEILQVNYQTVVGWNHGKVIEALKTNTNDITFTLKKRPRNLSQPGQIQRPKQNPMLHPNNPFVSSLPIRRPNSSRRKVVRDDMYLPPRVPDKQTEVEEEEEEEEVEDEEEEEEEEEERPPDTPSMLPDSPMDTDFTRPTGFPLTRRPTMVPGMALAKRNKLARLYRPRSLPSSLDDLHKAIGKGHSTRGMKSGKIEPLPHDLVIPRSKVKGQMSNTEPTPDTPKYMPTNDAEETVTAETASNVSAAPPQPTRKHTVTFEDEKDANCHGNRTDDGDVSPDCSASSRGQSSIKKESKGDQNTNNNEDTHVPGEVKDLISIVADLIDDHDFEVLECPRPDETDGPGKSRILKHNVSNASSVDSTDGVKLRRKRKEKIQIRRGVSCADLGAGDCQGLLYKKTDSRTIGSKWSKMWFVLKEFVLYYYKDERSEKAKGVMCLPGCQVLPTPESNRSHAFRITHEGVKDLCLAASNIKDLKHWMEKLQLASIMYKNESNLRQSRIITESLHKRLEMGVIAEKGYHSESTDDDSRTGSYDIPPTIPDCPSPSKSDSSISTSSQSGSQAESMTSTDAASALARIEEASPDEFVEEWKKMNNVTVTGLGTSFRAKGRERPSLRIPRNQMTVKAQKSYDKNMMLRKLKAKQSELEIMEKLLSQQSISPVTLREWNDQHGDILERVSRTTRSDHSSDSDPDSQDLPLSSSMSSIATTSTASGHEASALVDDVAPFSDGTTSGCDVQTPISDVSPVSCDMGEKTITSTLSVDVASPKKSADTLTMVSRKSLVLSSADSPKDSTTCVQNDEETSRAEERVEGGADRDAMIRIASKTSETTL